MYLYRFSFQNGYNFNSQFWRYWRIAIYPISSTIRAIRGFPKSGYIALTLERVQRPVSSKIKKSEWRGHEEVAAVKVVYTIF